MQIVLTPEILVAAYSQGLFPMAETAGSPYVHWYCPELRGQLSIQDMHVPKRLKKSVRQMKIKGKPYEIRINTDFKHVINSCAMVREGREDTWINPEIQNAYCDLHELGYAHSVECWQDGEMVGGLYGVALGAAFFGESMFSTATDASKVALVHLVARLKYAGYELLDTQFTNDHLEQFGVYEVHHKEYVDLLEEAVQKVRKFNFSQPDEHTLVQQYLET